METGKIDEFGTGFHDGLETGVIDGLETDFTGGLRTGSLDGLESELPEEWGTRLLEEGGGDDARTPFEVS